MNFYGEERLDGFKDAQGEVDVSVVCFTMKDFYRKESRSFLYVSNEEEIKNY